MNRSCRKGVHVVIPDHLIGTLILVYCCVYCPYQFRASSIVKGSVI